VRVAKDQQWAVEHKDEFVKQYLDPMIIEEGLTFDIKVYEKEDDLIKDYFNDMHIRKPDFCAWWNMSFDIPTILNRLRRLGYTEDQIADIICHPDVPKQYRYVKWIPDPKRKMFESGSTGDEEDDGEAEEEEDDGASKNSKNKPHPSRLVDTLEAPGYTQHYDQMSTYSCMRKRFLLPSYKLDDISEKAVGIGKYNLAANGYSIKDCNVKNWLIFIAYNIRDSFCQYKIEQKVRDMPQNIVCGSNTRWSKTFQMSICVKNEIMLYLMRQGNIIGNSIDYNIVEHFQGALVGLPSLIEQYGIPIFGCKKSYVFSNACDADASSLYPSMIISHNISKDALFGRITAIYQGTTGKYLGNGVNVYENDPVKTCSLMMDLQTIDISLFDVAKQYMGLPTPGEIINMIGDKLRKVA
jgi:DNA polymerase elongation subunit (family B)